MNIMKRVLKISWMVIKGIYYSILSIIKPNGGLEGLLKLGALITDSKANHIALNRIKEHLDARHLIRERYSLGLPSLEEMSHFHKNSTGYLFYKQMTGEGLDLFPYVDKKNLTEVEYMRERRREIHDILHVVLEYDTSLKGEAALNMFLAAQSGMPISYLVVVGVILKFIFKQPHELKGLMDLLAEAWQKGKNSKCIFGIKWEKWLEKDVEEIRNHLAMPQYVHTSFRLKAI